MHVLVYVMDALRADYLSCYGHGAETSPSIDAFAEDAVRYTNAYSTATWTKPAAASILTGRQPRAVDAMRLLDRLPDLDATLQSDLAAAGFETLAVSANTFVAEEFGFTGFDTFRHLQQDPTTRGDRRGAETRGHEDAVLDRLGIDGSVTPLSEDINEVLFDFYETVDAGADTFALAWSIDTHGPYFVRGGESHFGNDPTTVVAESELSPETVDEVRSLYRDMVRYNDDQFGRLLAKLRSEGLYEDALVVLVADHGESFGDHGRFLGRPIYGHSGVVYEEVVRVPMLVKYPGEAPAGRTVDSLVQLTDVYPTVADACGFEPSVSVHGRSLKPDGDGGTGGVDGVDGTGTGGTSPGSGGRTVFVESQPTPGNVYSGAVRRGDEKFLRIRKDWRWRRDPRRMAETLLWKLTVPSTQLFDLSDDPGETRDRSAERPDTVDELGSVFERTRTRLDEQRRAVDTDRLADFDDETERRLEALGYLE